MDLQSFATVELVNDTVRLREFNRDDLDALLAVVSDMDALKYTTFERAPTREEEVEFLHQVAANRVQKLRTQYELAVVEPASHEIVGICRIGVDRPDHRSGDIGYVIRPDCWGRGYATAAAGLLIEFGFDRIGLHRIWACHDPDNAASGRVLEKVGMQREGMIRHHVFVRGSWRDSVTYSILDHERSQ